MEQREGFSDMDLQKLNNLYKCKRSMHTDEEDDEHSIVTTKAAEICEDKSYYCSLYSSLGYIKAWLVACSLGYINYFIIVCKY